MLPDQRTALPLAVGLLFGGLLAFSQRPGTTAPAPEPGPAPGTLTLLDPKGAPTGFCPLKHTSVNADVSGFVARVNVEQEFQNQSKTPVEAVYTFPLPEDAAVDAMTMTLGKRVIEGEIKRREEARKIYEAAKSEGRAASLLDQERPNIFTQSVANLMPGEKVSIRISYVNLLKYDEGKYEFTFPMVVGPRNVAGPSYDGAPGTPPILTDPGKITPPIAAPGTRAGHDISIRVNLDAGVPLEEVKSQLHTVSITKQGETGAMVRLKEENTIPNKDFILRYTVAGDKMQTGVLAHSPGKGSGYFTLILQPPAAPQKQEVAPKEMVFVIDQTGSQRGEPIKKAKETMKYCLENLNPGDTFQLIGFNTDLFPCFDAPVPVTEANMKKALAYIEPIEGNGGTDILKSIDYALKLPADPRRPRIIAYLTDGYVGNDMQIIEHVRKNRGQVRVFPFGVGNSVNRFLIDGMAREGRGAPYYVTLNTPGEQAASKFYARVAKPLLLDPAVDWNGMPVADVYPRAIPDVFTAGPIILKGRYTRAGEGDVTVRGLLRGQPWSQTVHVKFPEVEKEGSAIPTLWARERLEDLQSQDWTGAQSGNPDPKIKDQIVNLALDYRLMSQYTSFVAVEQKVVNVGGKQRRIDVPVEMPEGVSMGLETEGLARLSERRSLGANGAMFRNAYGGGSGGGGFGFQGGPASPTPGTSFGVVPPAAGTVVGKPPSTLPQLREAEKRDFSSYFFDGSIASGTDEAKKRLEAMKPEERRALLLQVKLAPELRALVDPEFRKAAGNQLAVPTVKKGSVEVQVWLNSLTPAEREQLKKAGFKLAAELKPGKLVLGTVPMNQLQLLMELGCVRMIEVPRYLN